MRFWIGRRAEYELANEDKYSDSDNERIEDEGFPCEITSSSLNDEMDNNRENERIDCTSKGTSVANDITDTREVN